MRAIAAARYEDRLKALFAKVRAIEDDELQSHWARYLCVLTCGYLEVSIPAIYSEYAKTRSSPEVARFATRKLERFASPNHASILSLSSSFNPEWETELVVHMEGRIKDHVNSLVANRHLIAHGRDTGITIVRVKEWFESAMEVIQKVESQCEL